MGDTLRWTSLIASDCFSHSVLALDFSVVCRHLSTTCRTLRQAIPKILRRDSYQLARQLVKGLVREASSAWDDDDGIRQYQLSLGWVLARANIPASVIQEDIQEYLKVSGMHFAIANRLVMAGARVSYEQLAAAARDQLEAAWIFVMAMRRRKVLKDMPALMGAALEASVFGLELDELPSLADETSESLVDMLFIAITALRLDLAPRIFRHIVSAPAAQQIDTATALQLLTAAIKACSNDLPIIMSKSCFSYLLRLPAVSDVEAPADISKLLHLGLQFGLPASSLAEMGDRLGVSNLSDDAFAALLAAAVPASVQHRRQNSHTYLECVIKWRPEYCFQHMQAAGSQGLFDMLTSAITALGTSGVRKTTAIYQLATSVEHPWTALFAARQQLSVSNVVELLKTAVDVCDSRGVGPATIGSCLRHICSLPAAAGMTAEDFKQMLQAMFLAANSKTDLAANSKTGGADAIHIFMYDICRLPAAAKVTSEDLKQLMQAAVTSFGNRNARSGVVGCCLSHMCALKAAAELTAGDLEQLLQMAIDLKAHECISGLLSMRLAEQLETPMKATAAAALACITASRGDPQAVKELLRQRILLYMNKDQAQAAAVAAMKALLNTEAHEQQQLQPGPVRAAAAGLLESNMTQDEFDVCVQLALRQPDGIDTVTAGQLVQAAVILAQGAEGREPALELSLMLAPLLAPQVLNRLG